MKAILRHEEWKNEPKFITLSHDLRHITTLYKSEHSAV